ncbi:hypothetical protein Y032_0001g22 [Ancylostoma ceylanicum]|uniref:Uncharacterized protein n=1 Tax=Ancylostoma ceylanicum TaxID=53326 RepID=A0A016W362_9BILA|nr:hypothetical protein Y032_0001g22 [Ancylostoma ceylanicum]
MTARLIANGCADLLGFFDDHIHLPPYHLTLILRQIFGRTAAEKQKNRQGLRGQSSPSVFGSISRSLHLCRFHCNGVPSVSAVGFSVHAFHFQSVRLAQVRVGGLVTVSTSMLMEKVQMQ